MGNTTYQDSANSSKTYLCFTVNGKPDRLHTLDLKVISPLFSTELNINMGLIKLILANYLDFKIRISDN